MTATQDALIQMPEAEKCGLIQTLNQMGYMTSHIDPYSQAFVDHTANVKAPVLEIGAAYGIASLAALKKGAKVIANDADARHLEILKRLAPQEMQDNLRLMPGYFPQDLKIESGSVGAVLICRVLHFFSGEMIETALREIYRYLVPGGKLFLVSDSPYMKCLSDFLPTYQSRKEKGETWPGAIQNIGGFAPTRAGNLPSFFHVVDPDVLNPKLIQVGFKIEKSGLFPQPNYPDEARLDGRESMGCIAIK